MSASDIKKYPAEMHWHPHPGTDLERVMTTYPGWVDPGPRGPDWCGVRGAELFWALRGPEGAVTFSVSTGWVPGRTSNRGEDAQVAELYPMAHYVLVHSVEELSSSEASQTCKLLPGNVCFSHAQDSGDLLEDYALRGDVAIWERLEDTYAQALTSPSSDTSERVTTMQTSDIADRFPTGGPPTPEQKLDSVVIRDAALDLASEIDSRVPDGRWKSLALTNLEEVLMWANKAIFNQPNEGNTHKL